LFGLVDSPRFFEWFLVSTFLIISHNILSRTVKVFLWWFSCLSAISFI